MEILEERKTNLLRQIELIKKGIDLLNWPEYKEMALRYYTGSVNYTGSIETRHINRN